MQNDRNNDILDGDFDDFDDIDDGLMDDDWDEFDDEGLDVDVDSDTTIQPPQKKSSLPRIIAFSLIFILILGGGFFFYSQFIVPTAEQKRQESQITADEPSAVDQEAAVEYVEAEGLPPMPSALTASDQNAVIEEELTPLPDLEDITVEQLSDEGTKEAATETTENLPDALDILSSDNSYEETPLETPDVMAEEPAQDTFDNVFSEIDAMDNGDKEAETSITAIDEQSDGTKSLSNEDIQALQDVNQSLIDKIKDYEAKIERLEQKIDGMKDASTTRTVPPPKTAPTKQVADKTNKKPVSTKKYTPQPKKWVLRSAQPGKAVVSAKGSSDMKNVEVGDSLTSVGRIKSISVVDGRWVVQGTKGKISQ